MTPRPPSEDSTQHPDAGADAPAPVKKTAAKKTAPVKRSAATKKTAAKRAPAKRAPAEGVPAGETAAEKAAVKKATAKKTTTTTAAAATAAKKTATKKAATKKTAGGGKAAPRKVTVAEGAADEAPTKKTAAKKTTAKKLAAKKTAKAVAKKAAPAKAVAKKAAPAKAVTKAVTKAVAKKAAVKKTAAKKAVTAEAAAAVAAAPAEAVVEKAVTKKAAAKKTVTKRASAKKAVKVPQDAASAASVVPPGAATAGPEATAAQPTASGSVLTESATGPEPALPHQTTTEPAGPEPLLPHQATTDPATPDPVLPKQATTEPTGPAPVPAAPAAPPALTQPAFSPAMDGSDRERLLAGTHHAPHSVLGAHPAPGGVVFRVFRPYALGVSVVAGSLRAELHDDGGGFFSALLPLREVPGAYRLLVSYEGTEQETEDAYRFLPAIGELDLYLIGEGRHEELWRALGAQPMTHQGVTGTRFTVWAPNARGVRLAGTFNFWDGSGFPMRSLGSSGVWELFVPGIGEGELYKFEITRPDGSKTLRADPMARRTEVPPLTSSVVHASHYEWTDEEWLAARTETPAHEAPFSVYEVHLPSWRPGLTYRQLAEQLPAYVSDLGFTHVELLPIAEHPFGGSWGYQVTGFYAPTARLGTPDDFKYLVDALHRAGIGVLMDWVPAHFPRDDWALAEFDGRPLYEHEDPLRAAHPDWGTLEFDYGRREVRNFLVANALYWCEEYHIDGLRVDAVASMLYLDYSREAGQWTPNEHGGRENLDAVAFLQEMNATVYRRVPGVVTIAEESTAWDGVTRATHHTGPGGFGGLGFGLKWNMGWMHDSLGYMAKEPVHRKHHHHEMTFSMVYAYSENYVLPISHDEVVHGKRSLVSKMPGDWWQQRADHRAYLGFMWAHPGKQLLFMGQEFAQGAEWSEAHGPDWWLLDPAYGAEADHRGVRDLVRDLNHTYRRTPALWEQDTRPAGFSWITGDSADDNVLAFLRLAEDGTPLLAVSNFSPVVREEYRLGVPEDVPAWREILNTDAAAYGGTGATTPDPVKPDPHPWHARPASIRLTLPPLTTLWLRPA
ncbi:1,4-alpha-glucan branching enzyme [Streptomyces griseiscabiei]|uniref:1,4-alpha-glucan branching enzyme GlgB n=2 Tax=Streptomyces griseiscabiei TaxID=2993540 RepID=A0ABU4LG39_9ACTN|nr:1,4-alpha-glucan branching enzyme [Streptomyces griseiscabiei]MBZ3903886.1 1,4-alpha-glucan branching enzyme [Streptomyces griseiscabiei]MDX2914757.1 1,4-alpha-glucan branching enzyme [Streptomyces griseiscabiei]